MYRVCLERGSVSVHEGHEVTRRYRIAGSRLVRWNESGYGFWDGVVCALI